MEILYFKIKLSNYKFFVQTDQNYFQHYQVKRKTRLITLKVDKFQLKKHYTKVHVK